MLTFESDWQQTLEGQRNVTAVADLRHVLLDVQRQWPQIWRGSTRYPDAHTSAEYPLYHGDFQSPIGPTQSFG